MKGLISIATAIIIMFCSLGCNNQNNDNNSGESDFYIEFLSAENSEPIYIHLKDGTNILIDLGSKKEVDEFISRNNIKVIDYLFLTDNNEAHYGAYKHLIESCEVKNIFLPYFTDASILNSYDVYQFLAEKGISYSYTDIGFILERCGAQITCLSPSAHKSVNGEYRMVSLTGEVKNITPVFYILYLGKRILLSSNIDNDTEQKILNNYNIGLYKNIDLSFVDLMRLSASDYDVSTTFVGNVPTKIAVSHISSGNSSGNPYSSVLTELSESKVYMTKNVGTLRYTIFDSGEFEIKSIN